MFNVFWICCAPLKNLSAHAESHARTQKESDRWAAFSRIYIEESAKESSKESQQENNKKAKCACCHACPVPKRERPVDRPISDMTEESAKESSKESQQENHKKANSACWHACADPKRERPVGRPISDMTEESAKVS